MVGVCWLRNPLVSCTPRFDKGACITPGRFLFVLVVQCKNTTKTCFCRTHAEDSLTMETDRGSTTSARGTEDPRHGGSHPSGDARDEVRGRAEQEKARAGDTADDLAGAPHPAADDLERRGDTQLADLARNAAGQFSSFAESLHNRNADDILRDARHLARTNPAIFIGGSIAIGFALSRLFKSSSSAAHTSAPTGASASFGHSGATAGGGSVDSPIPDAPSRATPARPGGTLPDEPRR